MSKVFIQMGKIGDVCSLLPILQHEASLNGSKPVLMLAKKYERLYDRIPFVERCVFDGDFSDLEGAIKLAKLKYNKVVVPQTHGGKDFPIQHRTPSFQLDQWLRAGYIHEWDKLPMDLPRHNAALSEAYIQSRPCILIGDYSESSPFPHIEELQKMVAANFPDHLLVNLSTVMFSNPLDLLSLYDMADLLVSIETAHLHLAKASKVPIVALATDTPQRWHGSAYSNKFRFHCRYTDFPRRKDEFLKACQDAVAKKEPRKVHKVETAHAHGYNLSTIKWEGRMLGVYRFHPTNTASTQLAIHDGEKTSLLKMPDAVAELSNEDPRLFLLDGKLHIAYIASMWPSMVSCVQQYGELVNEEGQWRVVNYKQPKYANNDFTTLQKNWVPFEYGKKLHFIYATKGGQQTVIQVDGERMVQEYKTPAVTWNYGEIRGGVVVPYNGALLRFFHSRTQPTNKTIDWRYYTGVAVMNPKPPFQTIKVVQEPLMVGNEKYTHGCRHWKQNVCIPYGAVEYEDKFLVSAGFNDSECGLIEVAKSELPI